MRQARKDVGLSGPEMAEQLQLSANHLYVLERGERSQTSRTLVRIARVTGRSLEWFRSGQEGP